MKLLILTQYYPPEIGAPQNRLHELAVRLKNKNIHVEVLTALPNYPKMEVFEDYRRKQKRQEYIEGISVHRSWIYVSKSKRILSRLLNYFSFVWSSYWKGRKLGEFDYPSAPQLLDDLKKETKTIRVNINPGEILCFSGSHLHSSSKENSNTSRFSYEIRTVSDSDIRGKRYAPNVDCALNAKYPKIFKHMVTKNILEIN